MHIAARATDRREHGRVGLVAVVQRLDTVAGQQRIAAGGAPQKREVAVFGSNETLGVERLGLRGRSGLRTRRGRVQALGTGANAVVAERQIQQHPDQREKQAQAHPRGRAARIALGQQGMAGAERRCRHAEQQYQQVQQIREWLERHGATRIRDTGRRTDGAFEISLRALLAIAPS